MASQDFHRVQRALRSAGLPADDFGRFVNEAKLRKHPELVEVLGPVPVFDYRNSVPILLELLPTLTEFDALDSTVRHLSTKFAKPQAAVPLMDLFERLPRSNSLTVKWTVGDAIGSVTTKDHRDRLVQLCLDREHGPDRQMIVSRIGYFKKDDGVTSALVALLTDPDVALDAMGALRTQIGAEAARPYVVPLLEHESEQVRGQATRELRKIDKRLARSTS